MNIETSDAERNSGEDIIFGSEDDGNPLGELIQDEELDRDLLLDVLRPFVRFDKEGNIIYKSAFNSQKSKNKILIYLLARKAMNDLGLDESEEESPDVISEDTGVNYNTARSALSRMDKEGVVRKSRSGSAYTVPNSAVSMVVEMLDE